MKFLVAFICVVATLALPGFATPVVNVGKNIIVARQVPDVKLVALVNETANNLPLRYLWVQAGGPSTATISGTSTRLLKINFTDIGLYNFNFTATNKYGESSSDSVLVYVTEENPPPVINALEEITVLYPIRAVQLNVSAYDDDLPLSYFWTVVSGSSDVWAEGQNTSTLFVSFLEVGVYVFEVSVADAKNKTSRARIRVNVINELATSPPIISVPSLLTATLEPFSIHAEVSDPDGDTIVSYSWIEKYGTAVTMAGQSTNTLTVSGLLAGVYSFELTVEASSGETASATVEVVVQPESTPSPLEPTALAATPLSTADVTPTIAVTSADPIAATSPEPTVGTTSSQPSTAVTSEAASTPTFSEQAASDWPSVTEAPSATHTPTLTETTATPTPTPPFHVSAGENQRYVLPFDSLIVTSTGYRMGVVSVVLEGTTDASANATCSWVQISGPAANLTATSRTAILASKLMPGESVFMFVVQESTGESAYAYVSFTLYIAPRADGGGDQIVVLPNNTITLTGTGTVLDGSIANYTWAQLDGPSEASLASTTEASLIVSALVEGTYSFSFTVFDNDGNNDTDFVTVTVRPGPTVLDVSAGEDLVISYPADTVVISGDPGDAGADPVSYSWIQLAGPTANMQGTDTDELTIIAPAVGLYEFELTVTIMNGSSAGANMSDLVQVVVTTAPTIEVDSYVTVSYPNSSAVLSARVQDSDASYLTYKWTQTDSNNAVEMSGANTSVVTVTGLEEGLYSFVVTATDEYGVSANVTVTVAMVGGPPVLFFEDFAIAATVLTSGSGFFAVISSLLGSPAGYILAPFGHLQLVSAFSFLRVVMPFDLREYSRGLRWSILQLDLHDQHLYDYLGVADPSWRPRRHLLDVGVTDSSLALPLISQAEYYVGNLVLSLVVVAFVIFFHTFLHTWIKVCSSKRVPSWLVFPRLEVLTMQLLYFGLALDAFMIVAEARSSFSTGDISLYLRLALIVVLVFFPFILIIQLTLGISDRRLAAYDPAIPQETFVPGSKVADKAALLQTARVVGGQSSTTRDWRPAAVLDGKFFLRSYGFLFRRFRQENLAYLFIPLDLIGRFIIAATLGVATADDNVLGPSIQIGVLLTICVLRFLFIVIAFPFIDTFENVVQGIVSFLELVIVLLVGTIFLKTGYSWSLLDVTIDFCSAAICILSIATVVVLFLDQLRILILSFMSSRRRSASPEEFPPPLDDVIVDRGSVNVYPKSNTRRAPGLFSPKRIRPEEMKESVFRTSIYLPHVERTFNVFVPENQPLAFKARFAGYTKGLRRGYILDVDPRTGNVFFWLHDAAQLAAVIHSDFVVRKIGKLLSRRKHEFLASVDPHDGPITLWDNPDYAIAGSREAGFVNTRNPSFPVYTMEGYKSVCALDGVYKDNFWRGHPFELVGFEFDEPLRIEHFANARISSTLDRACHIAKTSTPNFLRIYDFFAVRIPAGRRDSPSRMRVLSVAEPSDCDLDRFLRDNDFRADPAEFTEIIRGIVIQVLIALHSAQTCSFKGRSLSFRHNDLTPINITLQLSPQLRQRLDTLNRGHAAPPVPSGYGKRYLFYQVAECYQPATMTGDPKAYSPPINVVLDLFRTPTVKIVNFTTSSCRVLDAQGQLSADFVTGHDCPPVIPSESFDLRVFAITLYRALQTYQDTLGTLSPLLIQLLSFMAGGNPAQVPIASPIMDTPGLFPRHVIDHPFFEALREQPSRGPMPSLTNACYYVEHPKDKVVPSSILTLTGAE